MMNEAFLRAIAGMTSADSEVRVVSATEIYRTGRALADHAVFPWWDDEELYKLLEGNNPHLTVGLAVQPDRFEKIREASGSPRLAEIPADQDAREFEIHLPGGLSMDILTSRDAAGSGAIAKFLHKFGIAPVFPATRTGADGTRINFFLVSAPSANKVLIELYEPAPRMD